jgi:hypothetical protein
MKRILFACLILCLFAVCFSQQVIAQTIRTVALSGDPAPGLPGLTYGGFEGLHFNDRGEVVFSAWLPIPIATENHLNSGLWMETSNEVELIAREFDFVPGYPSNAPAHFNDFLSDGGAADTLVVGSGDHRVVTAPLYGMPSTGIWSIDSNGLELIAGGQLPAPGTGNLFSTFRGTTINANGNVAFLGHLYHAGVFQDTGIWSNVNGSLELIVRAGLQAPGVTSGVKFSGVREPALNANGKIAFTAALLTDQNANNGIWSGTPDNIGLVVLEGFQASGTFSGTVFESFHPAQLDADGRVLFQATLRGSDVNSSNDVGIWLEDAGSIELVARLGNQAPDLPSGVLFAELTSYSTFLYGYRQSGYMTLLASLTGPGIDSSNDQGFWAGKADNLHLVAREGESLPGLSPTVTINSVGGRLNDAGRLMLSGRLSSRTFPDSALNDQAFWVQDSFGDLQLIIKTGDLLEVAPGDFRQVRSFEINGFNNRGQVLFEAWFQTGSPFQTISTSGLFVSNPVAVPEPSTLVLSACLTMFVVSRRRN